MDAELVRLSKTIAYALRHRPGSLGITLDPHGWCDVSALLSALNASGTTISLTQLHEIVRDNDKARFALSHDGTRIRAQQGHSVDVDLQLRVKTPPSVLYHGTVRPNLSGIWKSGLLPMKRHHVHLSGDSGTAKAVGARRGTPVVLVVDAARMHRDGYRFYQSENAVWLTERVPARYLAESKVPAGDRP